MTLIGISLTSESEMRATATRTLKPRRLITCNPKPLRNLNWMAGSPSAWFRTIFYVFSKGSTQKCGAFRSKGRRWNVDDVQ
jgi:hypothetical protein